MADYDYDLFTIGAGSGGVRASRVSAAYGAKVAVAEEYRVGGTCVIRGCVPKKMLVYGAHFAEDLEDCAQFGWHIEGKRFDWVKLRDHVQADIDRLNSAYTDTLESHGVEVIGERAEMTGPHEIALSGGRTVTAKHILIATGAHPRIPDCPGKEHGITSNEAFHLDAIPERIVIAGGGYIANEFAGIFNEFGAQVTIINRGDTILKHYDEALRDRLLRIGMTKNIQYRFHAAIEGIEKLENGCFRVSMNSFDPMEVDCVMFATGRVANTTGLGLGAGGRRTGRARRGEGGRIFAHQRRPHLRGRRRDRPAAADPDRDPRGAGLRRHGVRQQAHERSITNACPARSSATRRSRASA